MVLARHVAAPRAARRGRAGCCRGARSEACRFRSPRRAPAADGPGRRRRSGRLKLPIRVRSRCTTASRSWGSPGPLPMMTPSASRASARKSWCQGTRTTRAPRLTQTLDDAVLGADVDQDDLQVAVAVRGARLPAPPAQTPRCVMSIAVAARCASGSSMSLGYSHPCIVPRSRSRCVSARVSMPLRIGRPSPASHASSEWLREVMAEVSRQVLRHEALHLDPRRLKAASVGTGRHAVVAHQRIREDQDLAGVRRVGQRLDVASHAGVEDDLAGHGGLRLHTLRRGTASRPRARGSSVAASG